MDYLCIRERSEAFERQFLSEYATLSEKSKGRSVYEDKCDIRTDFQRDRDRIIHCKAFRRLKHKTQVFLAPGGDHYRTRLTHTLEVSQIARTIARALRLNEDLTEAIALGHDLGHTPFGHAGESALNSLSKYGFRHYEQSLRVVERIEKNGKGLNLTDEVKNGILCHTKGDSAYTLEGQIVKVADHIAYINHDIDDALRAGVITLNDIPERAKNVLGNTTSSRVNTLVVSLINNSQNGVLNMSDEVLEVFKLMHEFMFSNVYLSPKAKGEEEKIPYLVESLYKYFLKDAQRLPNEYIEIANLEDKDKAVCDYIAGMTDHYAIGLYSSLFVPKGWSN